MPKCLIAGDNKMAPYHPLAEVQGAFEEILSSHMALTFTEDKNIFCEPSLKDFDLILLYPDFWDKKLSQSQLAGLLSFCLESGGILCVHNGISFQENVEFSCLIGAKFTGHPPYQTLSYHTTGEHPILLGVCDFQMEEEPYNFEFCNFSKLQVLLEYSLNEKRVPALWCSSYGLGRVVYLAPGHDIRTFLNPSFRRLVLNSALWAMEH